MKANKRNVVIALAILAVLVLISTFGSFGSFGSQHIVIDGDEIDGIGGISGFVLACFIGFVAVFFALSVTGLVLVGVGLLLVVVLGLVLGSVALAFLPLLIPFLALYGLIALFTRKKTA